jgi:drug/metabolite transporter (DMT)-like permease
MIVYVSANRPENAKALPIASLAMGYPSYQEPRPAKPPVATHDLLISIGALVFTLALGVVAAAMGVLSLAFLDYCPPETCSAEGAVTAVGTALLVAFAIGVVGLIVTVIQLYRRKPGWPFAVGTFALCGLAIFLGGVGYATAVG